MKATGIVRRIDDLGRVVIPKEIRRTLRIREGDETSEVFLEGTINIFNYPEYNNIHKAKEILELLHDKKSISELISDSDDMTVKIGDEIFVPEAKECSIISAGYHVGDRSLGTIALIGPRRINYSKVLSIMTEVMKELNETLKNK